MVAGEAGDSHGHGASASHRTRVHDTRRSDAPCLPIAGFDDRWLLVLRQQGAANATCDRMRERLRPQPETVRRTAPRSRPREKGSRNATDVIALLLAGRQLFESSVHSIRSRVIGPLLAASLVVRTVTCTTEPVKPAWLQILGVVHDVVGAEANQHLRRASCYSRMTFSYDWLLVARPDSIWFSDFAWPAHAAGAITTRARTLMAPAGVAVSGAPAHLPRGAASFLPEALACRRACQLRCALFDDQARRRVVIELEPFMHLLILASHARQAAIMPRHLAPAYIYGHRCHNHSRSGGPNVTWDSPYACARQCDPRTLRFAEMRFTASLLATGCDVRIGAFDFALIPDERKTSKAAHWNALLTSERTAPAFPPCDGARPRPERTQQQSSSGGGEHSASPLKMSRG